MHTAFASAGKQPGIQIWRIEEFNPVLCSEKDHGKFYSGDSYIILKTIQGAKNLISPDIFYWLGSSSTQDEVGAAAMLAVQLDDALGGYPVQHKETQGHESQAFLSLFPSPIRYLTGGVNSGFNHIEINPGSTKKLFQIKGKNNVRVKQVEPKVTSMNQGDCFILDFDKELLIYVGPRATGLEKLKATEVAKQIRDQDHSGRATVNIIDGSSTPDDYVEFFKKLGSGSAEEVPIDDNNDDDRQFEKTEEAIHTLYKISDSQGGKIVLEKIDEKPLLQSHLNTDDCFILDTGSSGIYVWIGKKSTKNEKLESIKHANVFIKEKNYPAWTGVIRVIESGEPTAFKQCFENWKDN